MTQKVTFKEEDAWETMMLCFALEENGYCQDPCSMSDDGRCWNIHEETGLNSLTPEEDILNEAISWLEDGFEEEIELKLRKLSSDGNYSTSMNTKYHLGF